jgi:TonB family protein
MNYKLRQVLITLFAMIFLAVPLFAQKGEKCDPAFGKEFLKKAAALYDIQSYGIRPFQIVMNYSGLDYQNKEIQTKISYYFESNDKWREEVETGRCKSVNIKIGNSYYMPENQAPGGESSVCPALIMLEPLSLSPRFQLAENDQVKCFNNKLDDGTEVIDIYISYAGKPEKMQWGPKRKPTFSRAFRFEKESMKLLLENNMFDALYTEIVKCKEMNGKIVPIYIQKSRGNKLLGQWVITKFEINAPIDPSLFAVEGGFKKAPGAQALGVVAPPKLLIDIIPDFPNEAIRFGKSGKVVVEVLIDENGYVADAKVLESTSPSFSTAAINAAMKWRFSPTVDESGKKIRAYYIRALNFKINPTQSTTYPVPIRTDLRP